MASYDFFLNDLYDFYPLLAKNDLFPEEGIWLWNYGIPPLSAASTLTIETVLGPEVEKDIHWYLQPEHLAVLLVRLTPLLDRIAQIVLHFSFTVCILS